MRAFFIFLYQIFIWVPLFILCTVFISIITIIGSLLKLKKNFSYYPSWIWARFLCIITFCKVHVIGREKLKQNQSYIFVANHQGIYDCWLILGYLGIPIKWVMKQDLRKIPFVGKACELSGFIFVDNSSPLAAIKTINEIKERLKQNSSIAIFPEGERTLTGKLGNFKKGAFQVALELRLPIVPVTLNGSFDVMSKNTIFIRPHKMEVIIHDPIITKELVLFPLDNNTLTDRVCILRDKSWEKIKSALWDQYK